jgi:hypothetical protein
MLLRVFFIKEGAEGRRGGRKKRKEEGKKERSSV